jgi:hypothetical protein
MGFQKRRWEELVENRRAELEQIYIDEHEEDFLKWTLDYLADEM